MSSTASESEKSREEVRTERDSIRRRIEAFADRERGLAAKLAAAETAKNKEEIERLKGEQEILALEKQVFAFERDNTGAFVNERWGQDLAKQYGEKGTRPVEFLPDGKVRERPEDRRNFTLTVAMGELDRMNKEGGQKAGDWALEHVAATIEDVIAAQKSGKDGAVPAYEIYRTDGNAFTVEFRDADSEAVRNIRERLSDYRGVSERMEKAGIKNAPPLAVSELPHSTSIAALDVYLKARHAAETASAETLPEKSAPDAKAIERSMVEIVKTAGAYNSEIQKYVTRCERMAEIVANPALGDLDQFFDKYLKKGLVDSRFGTPQAFRDIVAAERAKLEQAVGGAAPSPETFAKNLRDALRSEFDEAGKDYAAQWLAAERATKSETDRMIVESVLRGLGDKERADAVGQLVEGTAGTKRAETSTSKVPLPLSGRVELGLLKSASENAAATHGPESLEARKAKALYELEKVKRDPSTGLEKKRSYYLDLREKMATGKEHSAVFVDMAFLKYFDREGGSAVGDDAIRRAAGVLERAVERVTAENPDIKAKVYRYGGDEFTVSVEGDAAAAQLVRKAIEDVAEEAGSVPGTAQSKGTYVDQDLVFNIGIASTTEMQAIEDQLAKRGKIESGESPDDRMKRRSELLTDMADTGLGPDKAIGRFQHLMNLILDADYPRPALEKLLTYSEKAIFGEGKFLLDWAERIKSGAEGQDMEHFIDSVREKVENKTEASLKEKAADGLVMDLVVAAKVNETRLERRVQELESDIRRMEEEERHKDEEGQATIAKLREQIGKLNDRMRKQAEDFIKGR